MLWSLLIMSLIAFCNSHNLINGGKTSQSSTYTAGTVSYSADRAIDRNLEQCADSYEQNNSWWNIDLLGLYEISNITIYNVNQNNVDLRGAQIHIGNTSDTNDNANSLCTTINVTTQGTNTKFTCDNGPMMGRYVTVNLKRKGYMILCEVWINGTKASPFILINEMKTWEDALSYCRDHNMDLLSILNNETQSLVELEVKKANTSFVWLGLHYTCTLDFWFWVDDHLLGYKNWADNEPKGDCDMSVAIKTAENHKWYSKSDNETFNFICAT